MGKQPVVTYPNREKPASKITRMLVIVVLLVSTLLLAWQTKRGWDLLEDAKQLHFVFIAVNLIFIVQVVRWSRGVLPMAAAIATFIGIFAFVSIGSWYSRDAVGFKEAALSADIGLLTQVILGVQVVVVLVTIYAMSQNWQTEVEIHADDPDHPEYHGGSAVAA
ncbi:MAG: hypothetical protein M0P31_09535 [Solirubrobacteraceae bacterium]|nr:hypothetical protein [Solirubrobacteraceae bacterium]